MNNTKATKIIGVLLCVSIILQMPIPVNAETINHPQKPIETTMGGRLIREQAKNLKQQGRLLEANDIIINLTKERNDLLKLKEEKEIRIAELETNLTDTQSELQELSDENAQLREKLEIEEREEQKRKEEELAKQNAKGSLIGNFEATGYNLSVNSCGKSASHPQYGLTASGYSLKGHSRTSAMAIATDPRVIPTGSQVYIEFPDSHAHLSGTYTARDTGGAIKGNIVDIFMGENVSTGEVRSGIGRQQVKIYKK